MRESTVFEGVDHLIFVIDLIEEVRAVLNFEDTGDFGNSMESGSVSFNIFSQRSQISEGIIEGGIRVSLDGVLLDGVKSGVICCREHLGGLSREVSWIDSLSVGIAVFS